MPRSAHRILLTVIVALVVAVGIVVPARAQPVDLQDQRCINTLNKDLRKLFRLQGKDAESCLRDYGKDKLGIMPVSTCLTTDRKGKVAKARGKTLLDEAKLCVNTPAFGTNDVLQAAAAGVEHQLDLVADLFGPIEDAVDVSDTLDFQKCQQGVLKRLNKCVDTRIKEFGTCKRLGLRSAQITDGGALQDVCLGIGVDAQPDPKNKIRRACDSPVGKLDAIRAELTNKCANKGVDLAEAFPGCGSADLEETAACIGTAAACRQCLFLNVADALFRDCDAFDDGVQNGSCVAICGNGVIDTGEECDDGGTESGDGCRSDCTNEVCGDGIVDVGEDCDDGDVLDGDCCSATCAFEVGVCSDGSNCTADEVCDAGECVGGLIHPWFNEIDYDDYQGNITDRQEFVELAGPAGLDLSGYTLYGVEGTGADCQTPGPGLLSGPILPGYPHWTYTIPQGTVLTDDTGTGVGFLVICNNPSSAQVASNGNCDLVFPGISSESTFKNGQLLNEPWICPDGMLMVDPQHAYVDAVSYEGHVANAGPLGAYFHINPIYNAGADEGWKPFTSLEKWDNTLGRATGASQWRDSGGCSDQCTAGGLQWNCDWFTGLDPCLGFGATPGGLNGGSQTYHCDALFCGDGIVTGDEECDLGPANSDDPDESCRTDCTLRRCGDGIIDPLAAAGFPEVCEFDSDCAAGEVCAGCECAVGPPLGDLAFTAVPGSAANVPVDDGEGTWLRINQPQPALLPIITGSNGQWTPGPLEFTAGVPDPTTQIAPFNLAQSVLISAPLSALAGGGRVCVKVRPDYDRTGWVDCDGGSNVDVSLSVNSNGAGADGPRTLTAPSGAGDSGAGAAVAFIVIEAGATTDNSTPCEDAIYEDPIQTALTTGSATSTILNGFGIGSVTIALAGQPFDCSNWTTDSGASMAYPSSNMEVSIPILGTQDVAQVLRLNDD